MRIDTAAEYRAPGYVQEGSRNVDADKTCFQCPICGRVWEKHNGPVPDNHIVGFKNGDTLDCRIENLYSMSMADLAIFMMLIGIYFKKGAK